MELKKEEAFNIILDMRKNKIDKVDRAKFIRSFLDETKISISELGRQIGIPASTIDNWLQFEHAEKEELNILRDSGVSEREITRIVYGRKIQKEPEPLIDDDLRLCVIKLKPFIIRGEFTNHTSLLITEVRDILRKIEERIYKNGSR